MSERMGMLDVLAHCFGALAHLDTAGKRRVIAALCVLFDLDKPTGAP